MISRVKHFLEIGLEDLAHKIVGEYLLANVRGAVTVGLAVEERLKPEPKSTPNSSERKKGKKGSKASGRKSGGRKHWQQQAQ